MVVVETLAASRLADVENHLMPVGRPASCSGMSIILVVVLVDVVTRNENPIVSVMYRRTCTNF